MKKYLYGALALPLLFACSSDDLFEKEVAGNDQFTGIEKVDATFTMAEGVGTRMATDWAFEEGDLYGFAWLGEGSKVTIDGNAYQNHPLTQTGNIFKPQTSIYVGKYFLYRPYDETVVAVEPINFKSLEEQTLSDGMGGDSWASLANGAIVIGDKFTNVTTTGWSDLAGNNWDKAGIDNPFKIYAAVFSNQTGLDLTYEKNNVDFGGKTISGASDISYTYPAGSEIGAADIYKIEATLTGAAKSFTYAPTTEPNSAAHDGNFWETQSALPAVFNFTAGAITLEAPTADGISTNKTDNKGWFWFNSLPNTAGTAANTDNFTAVLETSYGIVTVTEQLKDCAYAYEDPAGTSMGATTYSPEWIKLAAADDLTKDPKEIDPASHNTFINQYGNHKGKYALTVDFSKGVMNGMHIKNDAHLQKALKYYIASGKTETGVKLNLDADEDNEFKISKISIALLQTINAGGNNVKVQACALDAAHTPAKIVVTQDGQAAIAALADKKEVPTLHNVFATATKVYLSSDYEWTWGGSTDGITPLFIDGNVSSIINEGTLTVNATNVELSVATSTLENAAGATMNITQVTTVKNDLTNLGEINVGSESNTSAELRAYDIEITNDATALGVGGTINNYGAVGVSDVGTSGKFNNYSDINVMNAGAITLLSTNELVSNFDDAFNAATNKMGTVNLPSPTALVSVANAAANGFIKYIWPAGTKTYVTPEGNVKYNTIVVSGDIQFTEAEAEIKYVEFNGTRTQVINNGYLTSLKGVIVNAGKSIIIEKGNKLVPADGTYLGAGATVYNGGTFTHNAPVVGTTASNYFGTWQTTQIVKY